MPRLPLPPVRPYKPRSRLHATGIYLRKVKGLKYQVRFWLPGHGSVNCGLYDDEPAAELVRREVAAELARHPATALGLWQALQVVLARLQTRWPVSLIPRVLPKYVRKYPDGTYFARVKVAGKIVDVPGPFKDPITAHETMLSRLKWLGVPALQREMARQLRPHRKRDGVDGRQRREVHRQMALDRPEVHRLQRDGYGVPGIIAETGLERDEVLRLLDRALVDRQAAELMAEGMTADDAARELGVPAEWITAGCRSADCGCAAHREAPTLAAAGC